MSPACEATIVAPRILSVPFLNVDPSKSLLFTVKDGPVHFVEFVRIGLHLEPLLQWPLLRTGRRGRFPAG